MLSFFLRKKIITLFVVSIFFFLNFYVLFNFGLYHDDWFWFFSAKSSFNDYANLLWNSIILYQHRFLIFPYLLFVGFFPKEVIYLFSILLSLFIFGLLFILIKSLIIKNYKNVDKKNANLILFLLILSWYFFPFNIAGQFWISAIFVTKISTILFLLSIFFIIKKKLFLSIISLIACFDVYEIFFISYLPIVAIFYFGNLIEKKIFKKYLIYSLIFQIIFLFIKKRGDFNLDLINLFFLFIRNISGFFFSIYSAIPVDFNIFLQIIFLLLLFSLFYYLCRNLILSKNRKFIFVSIALLFISLIFNTSVMTIGNYHYWGKGIFSRTFFFPSLFIFFLLSFIIISGSKKKDLVISFCIFIFSSFFFYKEAQNWSKSWLLQKEIIYSNELKNNEKFLNKEKNLVIFSGPCFINDVEIFNSNYDLSNAIYFLYPNLKNNEVIVLANKKFFYDKDNKFYLIGDNKYYFNNYNKIVFWDYYNKKFIYIELPVDLDDLVAKKIYNCFIGTDLRSKTKNLERFFYKNIINIKYEN